MLDKIVLNKCYGGYSLSEDAYSFLGLEWDGYGYAFKEDRTNPKLIECVETLGESASGKYACLSVFEYTQGDNVTDYDGCENLESSW